MVDPGHGSNVGHKGSFMFSAARWSTAVSLGQRLHSHSALHARPTTIKNRQGAS
jgi:hypothetical protein